MRKATAASVAVGLLIALLVSVLPAGAGDGDNLVVGAKNSAQTVTRLNTRGGMRIDNFKNGNPALILNVADPGVTPPMLVNSDALVADLNADQLDGMDASAFSTVGHSHGWSDLTSGVPAGLDDGDDDTIYTDPDAVAAILAADGTGSGLNADLLDGMEASAFSLAGHGHDPVVVPFHVVMSEGAGASAIIATQGTLTLGLKCELDFPDLAFSNTAGGWWVGPHEVAAPAAFLLSSTALGTWEKVTADYSIAVAPTGDAMVLSHAIFRKDAGVCEAVGTVTLVAPPD